MKPIVAVPRVFISLDGEALAEPRAAAVDEVIVNQRLSAPAQCEVTIVDTDERLGRLPTPGASLAVSVATAPARTLFDGDITAVEVLHHASGGRRVRLRGYDRLHRLRSIQPVTAYADASLADIARDMTADIDLAVEAPDGLSIYPRLIQYRRSHLDTLIALAADRGLHLVLDGRVLRFVTAAGIGTVMPLVMGETLLEVETCENALDSYAVVNAHGWNPVRFEWHDARAGTQAPGGTAPALRAHEPWSGVRTLANETTRDPRTLAAAAAAALDAGATRRLVVRGLVEGQPSLGPGCRIALAGVTPPFDCEHVVTEARHVIDGRRGYLTEVSTAPPQRPARDTGFFIAPALVHRIDDPEALGRVTVTLPTIGGLETDWLLVVTPGAGTGKGLMMLPDVDDQVVVALSADNPATGIVIGSTCGSKGLADTGIEGGKVARYTLLTPGGQRLELDDAAGRVRAGTAGGSFVEMTPGGMTLHAATDLRIEAPGRAIVISGHTVDFTRS